MSFTTEFTFADHDGGTLMTMIQTGFTDAELRDEHARGLPNAFDRLERFTRAGPLTDIKPGAKGLRDSEW